MNLNCGSLYGYALKKAVEQKLVTEKEIDELLYPLILTRFELGLFDDENKVAYNNVDVSIVDSKKHKDLAYETALKSIVLLENKNNVLPLKKELNYIFITGPNANNNDALIGNYFGTSDRLTTYLEGFTNRVSPGVSIQYKQGVMIDKPNTNPIDWTTGESSKADAVVACLGLTWLIEGEEGEAIASNQGGDMIKNSIPQAQIDFLRKLKKVLEKSGTPLIVVISGGCPVQLTEIKELADALILAWYPGEAGGYAVADIILGNENPSGRLPVTFVKDVNDLPPFEDYSMKGRTYKYMTKEPLYYFGYGLSYSNFEYTNLKMQQEVKAGEKVKISVDVKNTSTKDGDEIVQVYITDNQASCPVPVRQLAAFKRISLKAGEAKTVELVINPEKMSLITDKNERMIEEGVFTVTVGGGQPVKSTQSYLCSEFNIKGNKKIEL